ncbi:MAG: GAF domain-containing sensor histidine kinase [Elusimicrobia bacterium]|nr:GAF domain-containing sensor histidine kinase [Elusimicrobiota bacterium]
MTGAAAVVGVLSSGVAAAALWWWFSFRKVLPLEREARALRAELEDLRRFAVEALDLDAAVRRPGHALEEAASRVLGALHRRQPELSLAAFARRPDGSAALLAHRGGPWARLELSSFRFDAGLLSRAAASGSSSWSLGDAGGEADALTRGLAQQGYSSAAAGGWTDERGAGVVLAVRSGPGDDGETLTSRLELAAAALRSAAALAAGLSDLSSSREKLEGGLSAAMEELTAAQDRLIKKSKEIKTLHDVAGALSSRAAQAPSTLAAIVSIVARSLEADLVAFLILDEATGELVTQSGAYGLEGEEMLYRLALTDERSSSVRVFKTRRPFMTGDAQNDPQVNAHYTKMWSIHSLMVVPLVLEDRCIGVMRVGSKRRDAFSDEQIALVSVIAEEAAIIVETAILNRRLAKTAEQLATLNRMKDEFVSTVSHEFKTPLTTISGFLTVMLEGDTGPLNAQQMKFLSIAKAASKRLSGLVSDLLDLSRLEGGAKMELGPFDLGRLVLESVENHQPSAAEASKTLSAEAPGVLPKALGDERWMQLVLDNLVSNAIKFTMPGGRVRVRIQDKGEFVMVSVSDDGIGIPPEDREKVFERFYRAGNRSQVNAPGTGLGLAIAREVVDKHGGKIWLESELGKGTTFHFVVPAAGRERQEAQN